MSAAALFRVVGDIDPDVPTTLQGIDQIAADWVSQQLGLPIGGFDPCAAMAVVLHGEIVAGIVYSGYQKYDHGATIEGSITSTTPKWATRSVVRDIFVYPFQQMHVTRFQVTCRKSNKHAREFVSRLGFKMEGVARRLCEGRYDAVVYSMIPEECRWIDG